MLVYRKLRCRIKSCAVEIKRYAVVRKTALESCTVAIKRRAGAQKAATLYRNATLLYGNDMLLHGYTVLLFTKCTFSTKKSQNYLPIMLLTINIRSIILNTVNSCVIQLNKCEPFGCVRAGNSAGRGAPGGFARAKEEEHENE